MDVKMFPFCYIINQIKIMPIFYVFSMYTGCLALNGSKVKSVFNHKVLGEIEHFQMLDLTEILMCLVDLSMGTISGITHQDDIQFLDKHFICNTFCSSDDSVVQLIHICTSYDKQCFLHTPSIRKSGGLKYRE
jgi:hypothetical protein